MTLEKKRPPSKLDTVLRVATGMVGAGLFVVGAFLSIEDKTASATTSYGFGFLLFVLVFLSKFRRFKGLGFEGETWEEKQEEAAEVIERLRSASAMIGKQVIYLARYSGSFESQDLAGMVALEKSVVQMLTDTGVSPEEIRKVIAPLAPGILALAESDFLQVWMRGLLMTVAESARPYKEPGPPRVFSDDDLRALPDKADWLSEADRDELKAKVDFFLARKAMA